MMKIKLLAALAAVALAGPALGQSGQLTPKDTAKLEVGQDKMEANQAKPKSGAKTASKDGTKKVAKAQGKQGKKAGKKKTERQAAVPAR